MCVMDTDILKGGPEVRSGEVGQKIKIKKILHISKFFRNVKLHHLTSPFKVSSMFFYSFAECRDSQKNI